MSMGLAGRRWTACRSLSSLMGGLDSLVACVAGDGATEDAVEALRLATPAIRKPPGASWSDDGGGGMVCRSLIRDRSLEVGGCHVANAGLDVAEMGRLQMSLEG